MGAVALEAEVLIPVEVDVPDIHDVHTGGVSQEALERGAAVQLRSAGGDGLQQGVPLPDLDLVVGVGKVVLSGGTAQGQSQGPPVGDPKGVGVGEKAIGDELKLDPVPGQGVPDRGVPLVVQGRDAQLLQAVRSVLEAGVP